MSQNCHTSSLPSIRKNFGIILAETFRMPKSSVTIRCTTLLGRLHSSAISPQHWYSLSIRFSKLHTKLYHIPMIYETGHLDFLTRHSNTLLLQLRSSLNNSPQVTCKRSVASLDPHHLFRHRSHQQCQPARLEKSFNLLLGQTLYDAIILFLHCYMEFWNDTEIRKNLNNCNNYIFNIKT